MAFTADKFASLGGFDGPPPTVPGRVLRVDADGVAYLFGAVEPSAMRGAIMRFVLHAKTMAGADKVELCYTPSDSTKGDRFAIARRKPYQGQRRGGKRPKHWELARRVIEGHEWAVSAGMLEADDRLCLRNGDEFVILTQDKDMRMASDCWHMHPKTFALLHVPHKSMCVGEEATGEVYGWLWFWLQMLHGDSADNIPGLPEHRGKKVGPAAADRLLVPGLSNDEAYHIVAQAYLETYGERQWELEFLEQGALLWMRQTARADWTEVVNAGPMAEFKTEKWAGQSRMEIQERVNQARKANAASPDGEGADGVA